MTDTAQAPHSRMSRKRCAYEYPLNVLLADFSHLFLYHPACETGIEDTLQRDSMIDERVNEK